MPQSNYPGVPQLLSLHSRARELQLLEFTCLEPMLSNEKALRQQQRPRTAKTKQILKKKKKKTQGIFSGGPVDKIPSSQCRDPRFDPG